MTFFRLIALAIILLAFPLSGWAQDRPVLPGARTPAEYSRHIQKITGYAFADPARLFHNASRMVCDGGPTGVARPDHLEARRPFCEWLSPPNLVVTMTLLRDTNADQAMRTAIKLTKPASLSRGIEIDFSAEGNSSVVSMADGTSVRITRIDAKPRTGSQWTPYHYAVLGKQGDSSVLLLSFSTGRDGGACGKDGDPEKCRVALKNFVALMRRGTHADLVGMR